MSSALHWHFCFFYIFCTRLGRERIEGPTCESTAIPNSPTGPGNCYEICRNKEGVVVDYVFSYLLLLVMMRCAVLLQVWTRLNNLITINILIYVLIYVHLHDALILKMQHQTRPLIEPVCISHFFVQYNVTFSRSSLFSYL